MSLRERWYATAAVVLLALLCTAWLWQESRHTGARNAVRDFVALAAETGDAGRDALVADALPDLRRMLTEGDFEGVLRRLTALREEEFSPESASPAGPALTPDDLWPPDSPDREALKALLEDLARRHDAGYDIDGARDALVEMARGARDGDADRARAALAEVAVRLQEAPLRPGFTLVHPEGTEAGEHPHDPAAPMLGGGDAGPGIAQAIQMMRGVLPTLIQQADPDQRRVLQQVSPLLTRVERVHARGRDVRPALAHLQQAGAAIREGDVGAVERLLEEAKRALDQAPPLRNGPPSAPVDAAASQAAPPVLPPMLPAIPGAGGVPGSTPEAPPALEWLDRVRSLSDAEYQAAREMLARSAPNFLPQMSPRRRPRFGGGDREGEALGNLGEIQMRLGPRGEIRDLLAQGRQLGGGEPGGLVLLVAGSEVPVLEPPRSDRGRRVQRVESPAGRLEAEYTVEGGTLRMRLSLRAAEDAPEGAAVLRLPLRLGGWTWTDDGGSRLVPVGEPTAGSGESLRLEGPGLSLRLLAPGATAIVFHPDTEWLVVHYSLPPAGAAVTYTWEISAE
jgi:hypothetical protein